MNEFLFKRKKQFLKQDARFIGAECVLKYIVNVEQLSREEKAARQYTLR